MTIFYFTATGNSLAVAKSIGGTLVSIPQVIDSDDLHYIDDAIGVVFPIYRLAEPKMVRRFLGKAKFEADYLFAIGTYGNMSGAAMWNVQKQALKNGYHFHYVNDLLMVDNYLPMFEIDKQIARLPEKDTAQMTDKIANDIRQRKLMYAKATPASRTLTAVLDFAMPKNKNAPRYIVDDKCVTCGICAQVCPAHNITVSDKVNFDNNCEQCYACIHLCPHNAIHLKNEKSNKRWRNPNVSLSEIIDANNRGM